jgi:hypothetical protein
MVAVKVILVALPGVEFHGYYSVFKGAICVVIEHTQPLATAVGGQRWIICENEGHTFSSTSILWEDVEHELCPERRE